MTEPTDQPAPGLLFVVSAPSGAGKTSLVQALLEREDNVTVAVSHTTRRRREGERDGENYHFVDPARFEAMIAAGDFVEYARVFDNYYGTSRQAIGDALERGGDVILEIDWQGAAQVRNAMDKAVSIFILPPSMATLQQRLVGRGQDDPDVIARRLSEASLEMAHHVDYDYVMVNDDFDRALQQLRAIFTAEHLRQHRAARRLAGLMPDLLSQT